MRLGLVIYGNLETVSGGYLYDRKLVEYLRRQGDRVEIISLPWRDYPRQLGDNFSPALLRRFRQMSLDILLQDELNHPSFFWINRRLKGLFPLVGIVHHLRCSESRPAWQNRLYRLIEKRYLNSLDGFVCNSQTTRREVQALAGVERPCAVAYPAGDRLSPAATPEEIAHRAGQPGALRLLFLGNVIPRKGLHFLLQALSRLPPESWELAVVGSLEFEPKYARLVLRQANQLGLSTRITFHGALDEGDLVEQFRSNQLLVVPSSYEGFGIAYLEGMGFGLPAIASTGGAAGEIITHGVDGYLIQPGDVQALSECIRRLAEDRALLARLSLAARQRFLNHPTWEQTGQRIREFLLNMLTR